MGSILVLEPGAQTTVQDLGRPGHAHLGVPVGGAADTLSFRIGNRLVGNPDNAPALEMALTGGAFTFESHAVIALAGADGGATLAGASGREAPTWAAHRVNAGETLRIGPFRSRARGYLCIAGGLRVDRALGSASTHLGSGFGGHEGRALRAGDRIQLASGSAGNVANAALTPRARALIDTALDRRTLRATTGIHEADISPTSAAAFWNHTFRVASDSNRVGVRLRASPSPASNDGSGHRRASEGMAPGAVQLPSDAEPIILLVDHPTTGGYPVVACLASVDLPAAAQLRPGDAVRFQRITPEEARLAFIEFEREVNAEVAPRG